MGVRACLLCALAVSTAYAENAPKRGKPPAKPTLAAGNRTFVAFAGTAAPVRLAWAPVQNATKYRVTWTTGTNSVDTDLPAPTTVFEKRELRAGAHQVTVVAVSADGIESLPAEATVEVVSVEAIGPGFEQSVPTPNAAFALGARFRSPGLPCELGTARGAEVIATEAGAFSLRCGGESGQPLVEVPIVIAPVHVSADTAPIAIGTRTEVHVTVASTAPIGDRLIVEPVGTLDVGPPERTDGGLDIRVTPRESGIGGLVIKAAGYELGRISLDIIDPPAPPAPETVETLWAAFDVGATVGGLFTPDEGTGANLFGKPTDPGDTIKTGPTFGVRVGFFPTRRLGVEAEVALGTMGYESRDGIAPLLITRGQFALRLVEDGRLGLRALVGGDVFSVLSSAGTSKASSLGGVHYGGAFTVETRRDVSMRFQALHVITVAQDAGYANCFELSAGVVVRLGRSDRWK
ncbi:MAG: hypothetical protein AB7T06_40445 [Kofleriaceae bacterium]